MKIECSKELISEAVSQAARFSGKHPTLTVLNGVLCEAKNKTLFIRATNLDIGIEISIPTKTEKEGIITVPAHILSSYLLNIQTKTVTLEEKNGNLYIEGGNNKTTIKCLPIDDFPTLPHIKDGTEISLPSNKISEGILSVVYSASVSDIKPELSSVYIYPEQNNLIFVSTDSFRLAEKRITIPNIKDFSGILIPYKNAAEIAKVLEGSRDEVDITFSKHHAIFKCNNIYITSRLIEGNFPDYKQIIPKTEQTTIIVLKQDVIQTIKTTSLFTNTFNQIILKVSPKNKKFTIETKNTDVGDSVVALDAAITGEDVNLTVNLRYFSDCLPHIHQDSLSISLNGQGKPLIIKGSSDKTYLYLVMPMNR